MLFLLLIFLSVRLFFSFSFAFRVSPLEIRSSNAPYISNFLLFSHVTMVKLLSFVTFLYLLFSSFAYSHAPLHLDYQASPIFLFLYIIVHAWITSIKGYARNVSGIFTSPVFLFIYLVSYIYIYIYIERNWIERI